MDFLNALKKISKIRNFSTTIDYVTMRLIPGVFLACTILMTVNQFTKTSIVCYTSTIPMSGHGIASFIENSCYLMKRHMDGGLNLLKHNNLYMWFPIILILQTSTLCLPKILWIFIGNHTNCSYILQLANEVNGQDSIRKLTSRLQKFLLHRKNVNFLIGYIITKTISLMVSILNIWFLIIIIFLKDYHYPFLILKSLIIGCGHDDDYGKDQQLNTIFETVVHCKVQVFHLGSINNIISQCLLTWNPFYEKIFAITTCLLLLSVLLVLCDTIKWAIYYQLKERILTQYLMNMKKQKSNAAAYEKDVKYFTKLVTTDLFFIIIMISKNVNDWIASEIFNELFIVNKNIKFNEHNDDDYYVV